MPKFRWIIRPVPEYHCVLRYPIFLVPAFLLSLFAGAVSAGPVEDLKPGEWYEVPDSRLDAVKPSPLPYGYSGIASVMNAWSGGAYDSKRDRLIVWGGGHMDYSGNEVYAFDITTLKWSRVTEPSADVGGVETSGVYPDGHPRARHTYNSIQYLPAIDRFCVFGAGALYPSGQTGSARTDCLDFATGLWERKADAKTYGIANFSAVDPVTGMVWAGKGTLTRFDPVADTWTKQTEYENDIEWTNYLTLEVDPKRRMLVGVGAGKVYQWDISDPAAVIPAQALTTTGGEDAITVGAPGLAYDPVGEQMVAWGGGPDVFTLDSRTKVWTRHARTGGAMPTAPAVYGTYGRFRYAASKNVFVVVNKTDENVFFFKLTAGPGLPMGTKAPAKRPVSSRTVFLRGAQVRFQRADQRGGDWDSDGRAAASIRALQASKAGVRIPLR